MFSQINKFINTIIDSNNIKIYIKYGDRITYEDLEESIESNCYDKIEKKIDNLTIFSKHLIKR